MADNKTSRWLPALVHGFTYTIPFLFATHSIAALLVIALTHAVIDRYRLAKYLIWFKNQIVPKSARYKWNPSFESNGVQMPNKLNNTATGFPQSVPPWMSVWLLIIVDNTVHIVINTLAIIFLGTVWVF